MEATTTTSEQLSLLAQPEPTVRYIGRCRCGQTLAVDVPDTTNDRIEFWNGVNQGGVTCRACRRPVVGGRAWNVLKATYSPARRCDIRCTSAQGHKCECQCGGRNHGADHLA